MNHPTPLGKSTVSINQSDILTAEHISSVNHYLGKTRSAATYKAYAADWRIFTSWCNRHHYSPLPASPEIIAAFLSSESDRDIKPNTLDRRLAAIRLAHLSRDLETPTTSIIVKEMMKGIKMKQKHKPKGKQAILSSKLREMIENIDDTTLVGARDRALLLLGFSGAFRRSEITGIEVKNLKFIHNLDGSLRGLKIELTSSKTNQAGEDESVPILPGNKHCPIRALKHYLSMSDIQSGPVFRRVFKGGNKLGAESISPQGYVNILKKYALMAGMSPSQIAGHSVRSGFITTCILNEKNLYKIKRISRHKSTRNMEGYIQVASDFEDHAAAGLF